MVFLLFMIFGVENKLFLVVFGSSRGFRELREAGRIHFLQVSSKSEPVGPSYDEKTSLNKTFGDPPNHFKQNIW